MVKYKCTQCGNIQDTDGQCSSCYMWAMQMEQIRQMGETNRKLHFALYGDGGCLGCTEKKRQKGFIGLGIILALIGLIVLIFRIGGDANGTAFGLMALGGVFAISGWCCPNGCCGEYKRQEDQQLVQ